jgi:hypothetical protein
VSTQNLLAVGALVVLGTVVTAAFVRRSVARRKSTRGQLFNEEGYDAGTSPIEIAFEEIKKAHTFFETSRMGAKNKAEDVLVYTMFANAGIAIIGVLVTFDGWSRWGIVSTALAALAGGLAAWDSEYRYRDLWIERTIAVGKVQQLMRDTQYKFATATDSKNQNQIADDAMRQLDVILEEDLRDWFALRGESDAEKPDGKEPSPT